MTAITMLWHTTAMDADYDKLFGPFQRLFGAISMHDTASDEPGIGRRGGMTWLGDNSIEFGAPVGEQSPVRNFVEKWGGGMHSIAVQVPDAKATAERLLGIGVTPQVWLADNIFFTKPKETAGLLLEWSSHHTEDDPRWGYALNPLPVDPVVPVLQYAFVTAVVQDPLRVAERMADVFGTEVLRSNANASSDEIAAVVSLGDCALVLFGLPDAGHSQQLWGSDITRNRFHAHGLRVDNLPEALAKLAEQGVEPTAQIGGMAYFGPSALPLPTFVVGELLPEDPRR
ncbi:MAG: hypothetical protein OXE04_01485 [bacterium]|nr:hypothetical protein [bacterium]